MDYLKKIASAQTLFDAAYQTFKSAPGGAHYTAAKYAYPIAKNYIVDVQKICSIEAGEYWRAEAEALEKIWNDISNEQNLSYSSPATNRTASPDAVSISL